MKTWRFGAVTGAILATLMFVGASCDDDDDDGAPPAGPPATNIDPDPLNLEIQSVTLPAGENVRPVIRFRVTDGTGAPVDLLPELRNWNLGVPTAANRVTPHIIPRFTLAQLDDFGDYTSYYAAPRTPDPLYVVPPAGPPTSTMTQAGSQPITTATPTFPVDTPDFVAVGNGVYDLTLGGTQVTGLDRTKTHTAAGWIVRTSSRVDIDIAYDAFNFVPQGGAAVQLDEVVTDAACNRCHGVVQAHGQRRGVPICITCHSPQTGDPETSRTVDFKVMIHKIHTGSSLPSVRQGTDYFIIGNNRSLHDYSEVAFPWHDHGVAHCTVCHTGGEDSDNWRTRPSLAACTSCHDNVKFDNSAGLNCGATTRDAWTLFADCDHSAGPITVANPSDVTACSTCHGNGAPFRVDLYHHGD